VNAETVKGLGTLSAPAGTVEAIAKLARVSHSPIRLDTPDPRKPAPFVVAPTDYEIKRPEVPLWPSRIAQEVDLHDATSFSAYVNDFKEKTTTVFLDEDQRTFTAILDYHQASGGKEDVAPRWCDHVATFTAATTPEWDTWFGSNKKAFGQVEFATFLEDNLIDVAEPPGADLLEITRTLEAKKDVSYSSAIRLNNGSVRINYDEAIKGTANTQAGVIEIPEQFTLQIQVIKGGSQFRFPARFKYRLKDRSLYLWYEIVRPHKILEQAMAETVAAIQEATGMTIRKGVAELPTE
jgi:uncharacterized protein YfdQ (DUF2303 family)